MVAPGRASGHQWAVTVSPPSAPLWRRLLPLAVLAAVAVAFFGLGLHRELTFAGLKAHRETLLAEVAENPIQCALIYCAIYVALAALSLPVAVLATMAGGFLFGLVAGTGLTVVAATTGGALVFLAARTAIGDALARRAGPTLRRLEEGFRADAFNYLLVLRLVPLFPFWLVNLAPALFRVPLGTFVAATLLGIIPGTAVFTWAGLGLGSVLERNDSLSVTGIFTPEIVVAFVLLAVLSLVPVVYRRWKARP
jgi:uncharacterized membrane protein YdjX (TVP38/TMEM64 family)